MGHMKNILIIFTAIIIVFSLLGSISASELSDNDINQNNNDNIISTIELEE